MLTVVKCPECGGEFLPAEKLKGQCPACLVERMQSDVLAAASGLASGSSPAGVHFQPPEPAELRQHFPQLEVLELVGQGGMGAVYKARQIKLDRLVALKILPREVGEQGDFSERFEREAKLLARLGHPNIVTIHDFGRAGDWFYFVMEYVDGSTLREAVGCGRLSPAESLEIVSRICDALQYAHDQGIVHRDIKPENVLLDRRGNVKIADFGLAKLLGLGPDFAALTRTRQVMGTPHYMAPEQMDKSAEIDRRADIYSLGIVLYEMLTGEIPLGQFEPPSRKSGVDARLDDIVMRALAREPSRRYQQATEMKSDIETLTRREPRPVRIARHIPWWEDFPGRFLGLCSQAAFVPGVIFTVGAISSHHDDTLQFAVGAMICLLLSFSIARCLAGFAGSWDEFRLSQWLAAPPLLTGYLLVALIVVLWPLLTVMAVALAPSYAAVRADTWRMFDEHYLSNRHAGNGISMYWLKVYGWGATASVAWAMVVAALLWRRPRAPVARRSVLNTGSWIAESLRLPPDILRGVFHPASPEAIRAGVTYALVLVGLVLLPSGLLMMYIAYGTIR